MPENLARVAFALMMIASAAAAGPRRRAAQPVPSFCDFGTDVAGVTVPSGFCIRKFADVATPRVLLFAANGDIFVSSPKTRTPGGAPPGAGAIFLFRENGPDKSPSRYTFASGPGFESVHGILIANAGFYYTTADFVFRVPFTAGATTIDSATPTQIASFTTPSLFTRFTHSLALASDGSIYVSRGHLDSAHCPPIDDRIGSVLRIGPGHPMLGDIVAQGFRNPLFIRCMPWGVCYAAELTGDEWETAGGTEKLIELHDGQTLGFPCCVQRGVPNPSLQPTPDCSNITEAKQTFPLHNTPFGFDWERDFGWPDPYKGAFFVGLHGDYANWEHAGLQWAPTDPQTHLPTQPTIDFALGFGRGQTISRVADVRFAPDGRLFFTDDQGGAIYWIAPRSLPLPKK
jgi:glucose/arabinose dehydrogenase